MTLAIQSKPMIFVCRLDFCNNPLHNGRGFYCNAHKYRNQKYGTPTPFVKCFGCHKEFMWIGPSYRLKAYCDDCISFLEKMIQLNGPITYDMVRSVSVHRITIVRYFKILESQGFLCAICRRDQNKTKGFDRKTQRLCIDHDHKCCPGNRSCGNCIRGLLCNGCNLSAGLCDLIPNFTKRLEEYSNAIR